MKATLLGYVKYKKKDTGEDRVLLSFLGDPVPETKGKGYFIQQQTVSPDVIAPDLRCGEVEIEKSQWSTFISSVRNVEKK